MATVLVTKQAAAQRQIDTAIRILFSGEDPLAVHTLAAAAHNIFADLDNKGSKKSDTRYKRTSEEVQKQLMEKVVGDWTQDVKKLVQRPNRGSANFLKHADKDPDKALDQATLRTDDLLLEACVMYLELGFKLTPEMKAFARWHLAVHPRTHEDRLKTKAGDVCDLSREDQLEFGAFLLDNLFKQ
jgi:hypothetical protein